MHKNRANSVITPFDSNNIQRNSRIIKNELKKITNFKKVLTRNSKSITNKYGKELLNKLHSDKNTNNITIFKKKKSEIKKSKFSSNIIIKNNNINNINKSENNLGKYSNSNNKNINVNIINSFKIVNTKEKVKRRNSSEIFLIKPQTITKQNFHASYKNLSYSLMDGSFNKIIEKNNKKNTSIKNIKYDFDNFKISKNITVNYKKNKIENNKVNDEIKIGFYSIMVKNLLKKYFQNNNNNFLEQEEFEEEKRKFLYQLFYCLELAKIYIFNFKQNKLTPEQSPIQIMSPPNSKEIPTFRHFYEIFSYFSEIKISSQEKFEAYPNIEHVNQYFIFKDKQIGKGGSSVVYLGEDEKQKKYAIKVTPKNLKANPFKNIDDYVKEEVSILKRIHSNFLELL